MANAIISLPPDKLMIEVVKEQKIGDLYMPESHRMGNVKGKLVGYGKEVAEKFGYENDLPHSMIVARCDAGKVIEGLDEVDSSFDSEKEYRVIGIEDVLCMFS